MKWYYSEGTDKTGSHYKQYTTWPNPVTADEIDGLTLPKALKVIRDMYDGEPKVIKGRGTTIIIRESEKEAK